VRKNDSLGSVPRRVPEHTLPVAARTSASLSQKRNVDNVATAELAESTVSEAILKRRMNVNDRVVVTFSIGRMTGEIARVKTERALMFNNTAVHSTLRLRPRSLWGGTMHRDAVVVMERTESLVASVPKA
jgi:hypothetical protein